VESFNCTETQVAKYSLSLLKPSVKALNISQKISIRLDDAKCLCFQYMIKLEDNTVSFVEFYCIPDTDE